MASGRETYSAEFFKKNRECSIAENCDRISKLDIKIVQDIENEESENSQSEDSETSSDDGEFDQDDLFNNEDKSIARLYRQVIDDLIAINKLQESKVDFAISEMRREIHQGHKRGFRKFLGIDFCKPSNRCGYLRRYATCHTGLVKKAIWRFFSRKNSRCKIARNTIFSSDPVKVVSLGGGPGNDLVGFCTALQETQNCVKELDFKIVDISQGWVSVFPSILKKANTANFGSLSKLLKRVKIKTGFMQADLSDENIFQNKTLSSVLGETDVVLMVKLVSFISDREAEKLIQNVVDSMQVGAHLIFIDHPYDGTLFQRIPSLVRIDHHYLKYELSFKPSKYHCPSIDSAQAHICVFEKEFEQTTSEEDAFDVDDS